MAKPAGQVPAVILTDPKYGHNVAGVLRACAAFGVSQLWVTGHRVPDELAARRRLPREERMKAYGSVDLIWHDYPFDAFDGKHLVAVEILPSAVPLTWFDHPADAAYVFGPEDGGLSKVTRMHCRDFVTIPSLHCLNLACAVNVTLADRVMKAERDGAEPLRLAEHRGWLSDEDLAELEAL
jgi:tRNA C32,U32 (ribose-2'-O)-methylase TrmJ